LVQQRQRLARLVAVAVAITQPRIAHAADIEIFCSNGIKAVMQELVPRFERATKHQVLVTYGVSADLKRRIDAGASFDIAVLTPTLIDSAIASGRIADNARVVLARSPMAIAVRTGTPKADIRTIDEVKRFLMASKTIAYAREGATGVFFADLVQRLGIAEPLKPKIKLTTTGDEVSAAVVRGDAELGVLPVSEIVLVRGLDVLGTFPAGYDGYVTMVAGVSSRSAERQAADQLLQFLTSPASESVLKRMGMERPSKDSKDRID
jgi:molybdate transport system substrate-binding protein